MKKTSALRWLLEKKDFVYVRQRTDGSRWSRQPAGL